jgi:hypothetical protein
MKQLIIASAILVFLVQVLGAQDSIPKKRYYKTTIRLVSGPVIRGFVAVINDSALLVSKTPVPLQANNYPRSMMKRVDYSDLRQVRLQRKAAVGRGILYGALIGFATGFIAGVAQGNDPDKHYTIQDFLGTGYSYSYTIKGTTALEKAASGGVVGGIGGMLIGGIIGAFAHKTFVIGGTKKKFTEMRTEVLQRIYPVNNAGQ